MFTGIIERTARILSLEDRPGRRIITASMAGTEPFPPWSGAMLGESISVNGVCLTVVAAKPSGKGEAVSFDAVPETLHLTTIGALKVGDHVNIERSLRAGDRFGGHYVTGHVDGVGTVLSRPSQGDQILFEVEVPRKLIGQVIPKGSIAVDGISLTVVHVDHPGSRFSFAVIPHTLEWTNLKNRGVRSSLNIETDAFGKWVLQAFQLARGGAADSKRGGRSWRSGGDEGLQGLLESGGFVEPG